MSEGHDTYPPNAGLDASLVILTELYSIGLLDKHNLESIAHRLDLSDHHDAADRVRMLPLSIIFGAPPQQ